MILDTYTEFCSAESVAAAASVALVGDVIDLSASGVDPGQAGKPLYVVIACTTAIITAGTAGTIAFALASDAQAAIAVDGTATQHFASPDYVTDDAALNDLNIGSLIAMFALPMAGFAVYERYLGILVTVGTTECTAGAIDAFLTPDPAAWKAYADASN